MNAIGITGHQRLTSNTEDLIARAIDRRLRKIQALVGISCLAKGADQVFAERVLTVGGKLIVILPATQYASTFEDGSVREHYYALLAQAGEVICLPFIEPSEEAYWAAGKEVVNRCSLLLAVWNGQPSGGLGGTADVVAYAREQNRPTIIVWPRGAKRMDAQ